MQFTAVLGFAAIAFSLIAVPGPDWAYILAAGARDHVVMPAVSGIMAGYALITIALVVGVSPLVASVPTALTVLTIAGANYLIYLGIRTLRAASHTDHTTVNASRPCSRNGYFTRGIAVSGLNPKGILIFLSILPQFTRSKSGWPLPVQLSALGAVYILITALFYVPLGYTAHRVLGARPRVSRITTSVAGTAMILVGLALLGERIIETLT